MLQSNGTFLMKNENSEHVQRHRVRNALVLPRSKRERASAVAISHHHYFVMCLSVFFSIHSIPLLNSILVWLKKPPQKNHIRIVRSHLIEFAGEFAGVVIVVVAAFMPFMCH